MKKPFLISLTFYFLILSFFSSAQTKKELEKKKNQLHKDIEFTNKLLQETKRSKSVSLNQLVTLNKKMNTRVELINTIRREIEILNNQINEINSIVSALEKDIKQLKKEYAKMIVFAYKNQSAYNKLMYIFAAKDFNQAYKRLRYLQQYSEYRKRQAELIIKTQETLNAKRKEIESKKHLKTNLLQSEENEQQILRSEKNEHLSLLNSLQVKEKQLKKDLQEKQKAEARLNKAIEDLIKKEIEAAKKKAESEGKKNVTSASALTLTPEALKLSTDFAINKGKLPWPVDQGVITATFGEHPHPVLKGIITKNNGIDIKSYKGAVARAIFEGQVTGVVVIPGSYKAVIVRHGEYLSVYSNLEQVYVKMGDKVSTKQNLGLIHTEAEDSKTEVHLEIWKGTLKMNPEPWLATKN